MNDYKNKDMDKDFQGFFMLQESLPPPELAAVSKKITEQLVSSPFRLTLQYIVFSVIGYAITLAICSQGGVGLSFISHKNSIVLMQFLPNPWCSILCGSIFSGVPFILAILLLNRFQRRFLLFRMFWLPLLLSVVGCFMLIFIAQDMSNFEFRNIDVSWTLSALITPYLGEAILGLVLGQRKDA